jgi:hypothetical protein
MRVTDNLKFQAQIPLYPELDKTETEVDKVKASFAETQDKQPCASTKSPISPVRVIWLRATAGSEQCLTSALKLL